MVSKASIELIFIVAQYHHLARMSWIVTIKIRNNAVIRAAIL